MKGNDFFDNKETIDESEFQKFKEELLRLTRHVKELDREDKKDWTTTDVFKKITAFIGEYPPLSLIKDIKTFYEKKKQHLLYTEIPATLNEIGLQECTTDDGVSVKLTEEVSARVLNNPLFISWAMDNGYGPELKETYEFGRGEDKDSDVIRAFLDEQGFSYKFSAGMHSQTLKRVMREIITAGEVLPDDEVVKVTVTPRAKVK